MTKTSFFLSIVFLLAFVPSSQAAEANDNEKPNVIFILCDDLGWGDLGVFHQKSIEGGKRHQTPFLDQMAADGAQLRNHYCSAPVCAPSRASLLTGVHQGHAQVRDNQFDKALENNHTLATVMKSAGYRTALIGKYGLQGEGESAAQWKAYPTKRGFDEFLGSVRHRDGHGHYPAHHWPIANSKKHSEPMELWHNGKEISADLSKCYSTDLFTAKAKDWITQNEQSGSDPFFLYLAYDTPHAALQVPTVEYPSGSGLDGGLQWMGTPGGMINSAVGTIDSYRHPDYTGKGWTDGEERFATMVRRIDDCVGDLMNTLKDLGIDQNTMVVFTSDNGPHKESYMKSTKYLPTSFESFGPFDGIKRDLWEGGIRMPTLVHYPALVRPGMIDRSPSQFHDWMATLADVAGVASPARCDGVSLIPRLSGKQAKPSQIYIEYFQSGNTPKYGVFSAKHRGAARRQMQAVHVDGFKGVRYDIKSHDDPFIIYDLQKDPTELRNLAKEGGKYDALQKRMHDQVLQMRRPNSSAKRPYDSEPVPALSPDKLDEAMLSGGFDAATYFGDFSYVPASTDLTPDSTSRVEKVQPIDIPGKSGMMQWKGYIKVPKTGAYQFSIDANNRAFLRVHQIALIDADFAYRPGTSIKKDIKLKKGYHPICLSCLFDGNAPTEIEFQFKPKMKNALEKESNTPPSP